MISKKCQAQWLQAISIYPQENPSSLMAPWQGKEMEILFPKSNNGYPQLLALIALIALSPSSALAAPALEPLEPGPATVKIKRNTQTTTLDSYFTGCLDGVCF